MPAMYPNTPAKRNMKLYKLRSTRTRAASHAVHKILKSDRRDRKILKKCEASNLDLRFGPLIETLERKSFGRGKTNLRIDSTWANTARHRGIGEGYTAIPKFFGRNRRGLRVCSNLANWNPHKLHNSISDNKSHSQVNTERRMPTAHAQIFEQLMLERAVERYGEGDISAGGTMRWNHLQLEEFFTAKEQLSPGSERDAEHESIDGEDGEDENDGAGDNTPQQPSRDLAQAGIHGHPQR